MSSVIMTAKTIRIQSTFHNLFKSWTLDDRNYGNKVRVIQNVLFQTNKISNL